MTAHAEARMKQTAEVVIVGGGVNGAALAWELARRGGRILSVAENFRRDPINRLVRALLDDKGEKVGDGGLNSVVETLPGAFADGLLLTADHGVEGQSEDGLLQFNIRAFDTATVKLAQNLVVRLGSNPRRIACVDGLVILTAGHITITLSAP